MKFLPTFFTHLTLSKKLSLSLFTIILGAGLLVTTGIADGGSRVRYERILTNGVVEVSEVPFADSPYNTTILNGWSWSSTLSEQTPLSLILTIRQPDSIGITHAYVPVSILGSMCPMARAQVLANANDVTKDGESEIIMLTSSNPEQLVRINNLHPNTRYSYRILAKGCNTNSITYEREFTTLPDPAATRSAQRAQSRNKTVWSKTSVSAVVKTPTIETITTPDPATLTESSMTPETTNSETQTPNSDTLPTTEKRSFTLPQNPREWIAIALLLIGTIGIIASFITSKKAE